MGVPGLIVFDFDGVLVDSTPAHTLAYERLWTRIGLDGPDYAEIAGRPTREVVRELTIGLHPSREQVCDWVGYKQGHARELLATRTRIFEDARPTLEALARLGRSCALGTGASRASVDLLLARFDLARFFGVVVTGDDVAAGKPDPEVFARAMAEAGAAPGNTLVVEDSVAGLRAALGAGTSAICVRSGARVDHPRFHGSFDDLVGAWPIIGLEQS